MIIVVGIGGVLGAISRYALGRWIMRKYKHAFPLGTWIINVSGSFALGLLWNLHHNYGLPQWTFLLLGTGFMGAYTTFSTFGYETIQLLQNKQYITALWYVVSSILLGVLFAMLGGKLL